MADTHRKIEAIERRLTKMMSKDDTARKKYEQHYARIKKALDASAEGNHGEALEAMSQFNSLMNETKLNTNV